MLKELRAWGELPKALRKLPLNILRGLATISVGKEKEAYETALAVLRSTCDTSFADGIPGIVPRPKEDEE